MEKTARKINLSYIVTNPRAIETVKRGGNFLFEAFHDAFTLRERDVYLLSNWTSNDQIYNISIADEKERTYVVPKGMETCKQNHTKLKPAWNKNQPLRA